MGIPISAVVTPLVLAALLLVIDLIYLVAPRLDLLYWIASAGPGPGSAPLSNVGVAVVLAVGLIGPGALAVGIAWLGTRTLVRRAGTDALVRALGGRPPRPGDLEEVQLGNLVTEMAIAAGVTPPRVVLLDGPIANAAALGSSPEDAVVLVSRRLLDELDRDETQGVVAHLIGSVGNGDLRVALSLLSLHRTVALLMTALGATFGPDSRQALLRVVRLMWRRPTTTPEAEAAAQVDELFAHAEAMHDRDIDRLHRKKTTLLDVLRFPLLLAHFAIWLCRLAFMSFLVGPLLALLWRSRRYLADSAAVQLTRNPDAVARALASLSAKGGMVPGAGWAAPLFVIGPRSGRLGPTGPAAAKSGIMGDDFGLLSFDPPMLKRLARLRRQGAAVDLAVPPYRLSPIALVCITLLLVPLGTALMGCALAITYVALVIDLMLLSPLVVGLHLLLRGWVGG